MSAFNVVRSRIKPGREEEYLAYHRELQADFAGLRRAHLVKTGDRSYCFIGEWDSMEDIVAAREQMVSILDQFRDTLEELGGDLGVTDPVSGEVIIEIK